MNNAFEKEEKYKLYRTIREVLHPSISKKNISNYKIIVDEKLLPLRIFYPEKVSNMENIIIYIHGDIKITKCKEKYAEISSFIALNTNNLVISIDVNDNINQIQNITYKTIKYIYEELQKQNITNITLLGDSTGSTTILNLKKKLLRYNININKYILFYPVLNNEYLNDTVRKQKDLFDNTLVIIGNKDIYYNDLKSLTNNFYELKDLKHGFLKDNDELVKKQIIDKMNEYLKG